MRAHVMPVAVALLSVATLVGAGLGGGGGPKRASAPPAARPAAASAAPVAQVPPGARSPRNASYSIDVTLNHAARTLAGREVITWRNISTSATSDLRFHLYYNAWKNTQSTYLREEALGGAADRSATAPDDWGWIDVSAVRVLTGDSTPIDVTAPAVGVP